MHKINHIILTGGVGSRLWPLSRKSRPKQYLPLFAENHSLFELTVKRNRAFTDKLTIVGNKENYQLSERSLNKLGLDHYTNIIEATPRNTAPAIAFAAFATDENNILLVTPADHIIKEGENYTKAMKEAINLAEDGAIVTFGIQPTKAETGYGYIESDGQEVLAFREKPDRATAEKFLIQGNFLWNSGMFCFKAGVFLEELKKYHPEVYEKSQEAWKQRKNGKLGMDESLEIPSISVDYAVMEKSHRIKVVHADFEWSDMGSFEAVYDYLKAGGHPVDEHGNMYIGSNKYTAFAGLQNCILIETADANLVLTKEDAQKVKQIYKQLERVNPGLTE